MDMPQIKLVMYRVTRNGGFELTGKTTNGDPAATRAMIDHLRHREPEASAPCSDAEIVFHVLEGMIARGTATKLDSGVYGIPVVTADN